MKNKNQSTIKRMIQLRKQLATLENQIAQYDDEIPGDLLNDLVDISRLVVEEEQKVQAVSEEKSKEVDNFRQRIIDKLKEYNQWLEQIREFEALFMEYIVRPGYRLKQAVHQREYLKEQYQRISRAIDTAKYAFVKEVDDEIHDVLSNEDTTYEGKGEELEEDLQKRKNPYEDLIQFDVDDLVEEIQKDNLVRDFKRIVFPAVHPDTSEAETDQFDKIFAVYKDRDYLLMEAYIAEHKGVIEMDSEQDPIETFEEMCEYQEQYQVLNSRLEKRIKQFKKDTVSRELENPNKLREKLLLQQEEIMKRIQDESEQILQLREIIKNLSQIFLDSQIK